MLQPDDYRLGLHEPWLEAARLYCGHNAALGTVELFAIVEGINALGCTVEGTPEHIARHPVFAVVAGGNAQHAKDWFPVRMTIGGLAWLCSRPCQNVMKHSRGLSYCHVSDFTRRKDNCVSVTGFALDDDGALGRARIAEALNKTGGTFAITYATASDGKMDREISLSLVQRFCVEHGLNFEPSDELADQFLNHGKTDLSPYRNVKLEKFASGKPKVCEGENGKPALVATFEPQERTRIIVIFKTPLRGEMLERLMNTPETYREFVLFCEHRILGVNACDLSTMQPVAIGYLPSGKKANQHFACYGDTLFDAVSAAEEFLANRTKRERKSYAVGGQISEFDRDTLRGVMLANVFQDLYPALCYGKKTDPLVLRRCPFCDEHESKTGQADNSLFCFNPDPDEGAAYPVIRCHHNSCKAKKRRTEEFLGRMIAEGVIDPSDVYRRDEYRIVIREK